MTSWQKAVKYIAMAFAVYLCVAIIGGIASAAGLIGGFIDSYATLDDIKNYSVSQDVVSVKIDISAANFTVIESDTFKVESNLKDLTVKDTGGTLTISENKKWGRNYNSAVLKLYVPVDFVFNKAEIETGAGKVTVDKLSADKLSLDFGAGEVNIDELNAAQKCEIDGGAGKITISGGMLCNVDIDMGVGEFNLTATVTGNSELDCGVGEANITLLGDKADYKISVDKGIGNIAIDGQNMSDGSAYGNGTNKIELNCGVGSVNVNFK